MGIESRFDDSTAEMDRVGGIPQSWRGDKDNISATKRILIGIGVFSQACSNCMTIGGNDCIPYETRAVLFCE